MNEREKSDKKLEDFKSEYGLHEMGMGQQPNKKEKSDNQLIMEALRVLLSYHGHGISSPDVPINRLKQELRRRYNEKSD